MTTVILNAVMNHLIPLFEEEFVKHEPELQAALINEAKSLSLRIDLWAKSKLEARQKNNAY